MKTLDVTMFYKVLKSFSSRKSANRGMK